jgi:hypothetical protein
MAAAVGLDGGLLDAVANANFKTLAEGPIIDAQAHRNRLNGIFEASLGNIVSSLNGQDPTMTDAVAQQVQTGAAQASATQHLAGALAAAMQLLAAGNAGGSVPAK